LTQRRVDGAKDLMRATGTPLAEIALACGFSDQGHLVDALELPSTGVHGVNVRKKR
jgi:transcriptional regulator GlxA family with amidase domain